MNSLLQTMFFTTQLRRAVYKIPTESDDDSTSVALALQMFFYQLQTWERHVGTKQFTRLLDWKIELLDSFMKQDVQECFRILLNKLESKINGTFLEGTVRRLYEGKLVSFIKCKQIEYESSRSESYWDIQLNVTNKRDIYESFQDYITTEILDGDNKYDAGSHGLQEAEKGVIFTAFPSILHLHLMRFQHDPATDTSVKCNDGFEFFEKINLDRYLKNPETETGSASYTLYAVVVHSGDMHRGHYLVFINPHGDGKWFQFDDHVVSHCTKTEAIQHNFGGQESTNGYFLVYIRDTDLNTVLQDATQHEIPRELLERLKKEEHLAIPTGTHAVPVPDRRLVLEPFLCSFSPYKIKCKGRLKGHKTWMRSDECHLVGLQEEFLEYLKFKFQNRGAEFGLSNFFPRQFLI